jgi:hypothetical protein
LPLERTGIGSVEVWAEVMASRALEKGRRVVAAGARPHQRMKDV